MRIIDQDTLEKSLDKIIEKKEIDFYHYDDIEIISDNEIKRIRVINPLIFIQNCFWSLTVKKVLLEKVVWKKSRNKI